MLSNFIEKSPKILVIGDLILDNYLWGDCQRISPEAPVQIIDVTNESYVLGGAGNVVNNLVSFGAKVSILSVLGKCDNADVITGLLKEIGVATNYIIKEDNRKTSKKSRLIASQQQVIRFDNESVDDISRDAQDKLISYIQKNLSNYEIVVLSDYGKGVLTNYLCSKIISLCKKNSKFVLVDPKGKDYSKYQNATIITPNAKEINEALGIGVSCNEEIEKSLIKLKDDFGILYPLVTLSQNGIATFEERLKIYPTMAREVFDVTGAGDTVIAAISFALSIGENFDTAIKFANLAAGVVVAKIGSASATIDEIVEFESSLHKSQLISHIKKESEIISISYELKRRGKKIIFTNGCFDILHIGHVKYLEKAKSLGDILIVGVNSDSSVSRLKGPSRPINNELDRVAIIASLESVDFAVIFDEDTPYSLIKNISPDILVKGGDYSKDNIVGSDIVDQVEIIEYVESKSTSSLIERIKNNG